MKKLILLYVCCALSLFTNASGEEFSRDNFIIHSSLDPHYVKFILKNTEAYYYSLQGRYFHKLWPEPLTIYYSETQSDTQQLLNNKGYETTVKEGFYEPITPAVYTHRSMDNGELNGLDGLFREIACHFVHLNYKDAPVWFQEGLACFLGEQAQIYNDKLVIGRPNPCREQILKSEIDQGRRLNIKRLFASSDEVQLHDWDVGCHFARAFFYWLHETGWLKKYLQTVQEKGYDLYVLEEILSMSYGEINVELLKFIKSNCYAGAYLKDGLEADDEAQKIQAFQKALELKPDYQAARLDLAKCYYRSGDYKNCRENLKQILNGPESAEHILAVSLMAKTYYDKKDYSQALEYYNNAWEHSDYYEYKYQFAYKIGNCFYQMQDRNLAVQWYKKFLNCKWEPESMKAGEDFVREYIKRVDEAAVARTRRYKKKIENSDANNP